MTTATLETCKGYFTGTADECLNWLDDMQPSFASLEVGDFKEPLRTDVSWSTAIAVALEDIHNAIFDSPCPPMDDQEIVELIVESCTDAAD